jgi:excisionase family DNA binding protein
MAGGSLEADACASVKREVRCCADCMGASVGVVNVYNPARSPTNDAGRPMPPNYASSDLRLMTLVEAARYLAVGRTALYRLLGSGELASVRIGRARRVPLAELERFVRDRISP